MPEIETQDNRDMGAIVDLEVPYAEIRDRAASRGFQVLEDSREGVESMVVIIERERILPVWVETGSDGKRVARTFSNRLHLFTEKLIEIDREAKAE